MVIELLEDKKEWNQFVETSPQGLLFHKWDFLKTVERHSKYKFLPYCISLGEQPRCIFPLFLGRERGLTVICSAPAYVAQIWYLGPAFDPSLQALKASTKARILNQVTCDVCTEIERIAPHYVYFTTVPNFLDVRFFQKKNFTANLEFTYAIDLERPLEDIWASFSGSCRYNIKRARAHSPETQQTNDVDPLLDIWRARFSARRIKVPLLSNNYLKELVAAFPQDMTVYTVSIDGQLATAITCCAMQKERYGYWIGGVNVKRDIHAQEYLIWEVIQRAKSEGFKKLDLGGGLEFYEFKSKFDPMLEPYCSVERYDTLGKTVNFAWKKLSRAKKLVLHALPRAHL